MRPYAPVPEFVATTRYLTCSCLVDPHTGRNGEPAAPAALCTTNDCSAIGPGHCVPVVRTSLLPEIDIRLETDATAPASRAIVPSADQCASAYVTSSAASTDKTTSQSAVFVEASLFTIASMLSSETTADWPSAAISDLTAQLAVTPEIRGTDAGDGVTPESAP